MGDRFPEVKCAHVRGKRGADGWRRQPARLWGLIRLCDYFNIPLSSTVAFGDSMNDYDIVKTAGIGIAMGNAMEELKRRRISDRCRGRGWNPKRLCAFRADPVIRVGCGITFMKIYREGNK